MFECNHVDSKERKSYCPICGRFLKNLFIGQPQDIKPTPTEILLETIYQECNAEGEILKIQHGAETLNNIITKIKEAEICFFDITSEIFNVAYELGYAIGYSTNRSIQFGGIEAERKYILLGRDLRTNYKEYFFRHMDLKPIVPQSKEYQKVTKKFIEKTLKNLSFSKKICQSFINIITQSPEITSMERKIKECKKELERALFNIPIGTVTLPIYTGINFPTKMTEDQKRILILTHNNCINFFKGISSDMKIKTNVKIDVDVPDKAFVSMKLNQIIKNSISNYSGKYDIIISHLLGGRIDNIKKEDAKKHNFQIGVISGITDGFWYDRDPCCFFIVNEKIEESFLRGSDIFAEIKKYTSLDKAKETVINLINIIP